MESLRDIISDIRIFLYGGITTLPLTIAGTLSILGLFTANYALLFFLVGYLILTPLGASILNLLIGLVFTGRTFNPFIAKKGDVCKLVIPFSTIKTPYISEEGMTVSSSWVAMISFFIGYVFTNGLELFSRNTQDSTITVNTTSASDINTQTSNRKSQAMIAMISTVIFAIIVLGFRFYSGCESTVGMILSTIVFIYFGNVWYKLLSKVGQDRLSDLFGIANRLLPPSAITNAPIACIPVVG